MDDIVLRRDQLCGRVVNRNHIAGMMLGMTDINPLKGLLFLFAGAKCASLWTAVQNVDW